MKTPLIGITLDREEGSSAAYSKFPWHALRENYSAAVARAGGLPMLMGPESGLADSFLDAIDGLLVTGGDFDVDPALFGDPIRHAAVTTKEARTTFEMAMARGAISRDMPVLGICGGQQLLHVVLGGALIQHIPGEVAGALAHEQPNPRDEPGHDVEVRDGTLLHCIVGTRRMSVNSAHHQAARDEPDGVAVNATAPDGVIEGIEGTAQTFCLGVQWHPEFAIDPGDGCIFTAFVAAARRYRGHE